MTASIGWSPTSRSWRFDAVVAAYVALIWEQGADDDADRVGDGLERSGLWRSVLAQSGLKVFVPPKSVVEAVPLPRGRGALIGNIFSRDGIQTRSEAASPEGPEDLNQPEAMARHLARSVWGRYVTIHQAEQGTPVLVFRDPSGDLDCVCWRRGGLTFIASDLPAELCDWAPSDLAIDEHGLADLLINPALVSNRLALKGLTSVSPGTLVSLADPGSPKVIWAPTQFLGPAEGERETLARGLVRRIDRCTAAWAGLYQTVVAEISGGLDSAILASALATAGRSKVAGWINYHPPERQGDERGFANDVADFNRVGLTCLAKSALDIDDAALSAVSRGVRTGFNGLDPQYDADLAQKAAALGAQAIFGGQGGDAVFFQQNTPWLAADALRDHGPWALRPSQVVPLAQWTRRSIWGLWARALASYLGAGGLQPAAPALYLSDELGRAGRSPVEHPWLADLRRVPPAKRIQVRAIANCLAFAGRCRRSEVADLVHPLLAQPVVEHCLSISALDLTYGQCDRAMARDAFRQRLPPAVASRRSKGDLTTYYGRGVLANLPFLKGYLLDGRLASMGLIDRSRLESLLEPDRLMSDGDYASFLIAAGLEAWVQAWSTRLAR